VINETWLLIVSGDRYMQKLNIRTSYNLAPGQIGSITPVPRYMLEMEEFVKHAQHSMTEAYFGHRAETWTVPDTSR
jgi:hypothetical protein